jgi:SOS-response transcriptional repressor LexA
VLEFCRYPALMELAFMPTATNQRKFEFWVDKDWQDDVSATAKQIHLDKSKLARRALDVAVARIKAGLPIEGESATAVDDQALHQTRLKYFSRVPCGPIREMASEASDYVLSEHVADDLGVSPGDFVVMAEGLSMMGVAMEGRDIIDGDYLFMHSTPEGRPPKSGTIVVALIVTADGSISSTIKHWNNGTIPFLTDGEGKRIELPADTEKIIPIGALTGLIRKY